MGPQVDVRGSGLSGREAGLCYTCVSRSVKETSVVVVKKRKSVVSTTPALNTAYLQHAQSQHQETPRQTQDYEAHSDAEV